MTLQDILRSKGNTVHSISPGATLDDVAQLLVEHNCGSLLVCETASDPRARRVVGIITERDILRACAARKPLDQLRVGEMMSPDLITGSPTDSIEDIMGLMTEKRIRHLPILENGELVGLISIGDIVKLQHQQMAVENHYLKNYIMS